MKKKYCKYCGGLLNEDRICSECGHKFFKIRIKKDKYLTIALAISTLVLLFISLGLYNDNNVIHKNNEIYKQQIADLNSSIEELNVQLDGARKRYDTLSVTNDALNEAYHDLSRDNSACSRENMRLKDELEEYYNDLAFYLPNGDCYHKWSCYHIRDSYVYYDIIPNIKNRGLRACKDCY